MRHTPKVIHDKILGKRGEQLAKKLLKHQGYRILEMNYKTGFGEADIIALKDGTIAFVEVKTRLTQTYGLPSEAVDRDKQERYFKIAGFYFKTHSLENYCARFDVVEVYKDTINHIEAAYTL